MSAEKINIGIIGAGENTKIRHIPGLQAINGVEIVGVCNRTAESSETVANEFGIQKIYSAWQDVILDETIDAIVIGTWPYLHAPATLLALQHNKHVLCEARMAKNATEAHSMLRASQEKPHLVAQIVPSPFTLPIDNVIKRILAEEHIGKPLAIEVRDGGAFLDANAPLHWRQDFDLSGYNVMSLGILYECIMRWLGDATDVVALGKTFVTMRYDEDKTLKPVRIPDHLDVIADMACGAQMHMQISQVTGFAGPTEILIFGDNGTLRIAQGKIFGATPGAKEFKEIPVPDDMASKWRVEEEFIGAIQGQEKVKLTTFESGVKYMEFTEAVNRSMQKGQKISLPL
jgi:predicted dehydrogenase